MIHSALLRFAPLMSAAGTGFVWSEHAREVIVTALLSMVPMFEGRYAVTIGVRMGMPPVYAYLLAAIVAYLPVPFILLLLRKVLDWFYTLPIPPVRAFAAWLERRALRKHEGMRRDVSRRLSAENAELLALFLFVALPVPGTGVWMGSAIASLFNMPRGKSAAVIFVGNAVACLITTLIATGAVALG